MSRVKRVGLRSGILWLLCLCLQAPCYGDRTRSCRRGFQHQATGICGSQLAEMVRTVCGDGNINKRAITEITYPAEQTVESKQPLTGSLTKHMALSYLKQKQTRSNNWGSSGLNYQGIVCECCYADCDITEYCYYCEDTVPCLRKWG